MGTRCQQHSGLLDGELVHSWGDWQKPDSLVCSVSPSLLAKWKRRLSPALPHFSKLDELCS